LVDAHRILEVYRIGTLTSLAPDLLYAEVGNIVWKKHRFQGLAAEDAQEILAAFRLVTFERLMPEPLDIKSLLPVPLDFCI
jgi:predicted nucleic acid-binding protein